MFLIISVFGQSTSWLEIIAMVTGIIGVVLTIKQSIFCFPIGILNVLLYAWIFFSPEIRLYADGLLQCIFALLLIYGWINWTIKKYEIIHPEKIDAKTGARLFLITISATIILSYFLSKYTNASYPLLDSSLTCLSLASQWMIAKKFIENWIIWIFVDIIYIPMYIAKQLPLTAVLYFIFLLLALRGYAEWKKKLVIHVR